MNRLVEEYMMLLQTQNGGKVIVDTRPALILQDAKTIASLAASEGELRETVENILIDFRYHSINTKTALNKFLAIIAAREELTRKQEREKVLGEVANNLISIGINENKVGEKYEVVKIPIEYWRSALEGRGE